MLGARFLQQTSGAAQITTTNKKRYDLSRSVWDCLDYQVLSPHYVSACLNKLEWTAGHRYTGIID